VLKAYVLFKKADKGLALTMSKKKGAEAAEGSTVRTDKHVTLDANFLPSDLAMDEIMADAKYGTLLKASREPALVGEVFTFRLLETDPEASFFMVKSLDASKKSKNFIALLPKCLLTSFGDFFKPSLEGTEFKGLVLEIFRDSLPVVSIQSELIQLAADIPCNPKEEMELASG